MVTTTTRTLTQTTVMSETLHSCEEGYVCEADTYMVGSIDALVVAEAARLAHGHEEVRVEDVEESGDEDERLHGETCPRVVRHAHHRVGRCNCFYMTRRAV